MTRRKRLTFKHYIFCQPLWPFVPLSARFRNPRNHLFVPLHQQPDIQIPRSSRVRSWKRNSAWPSQALHSVPIVPSRPKQRTRSTPFGIPKSAFSLRVYRRSLLPFFTAGTFLSQIKIGSCWKLTRHSSMRGWQNGHFYLFLYGYRWLTADSLDLRLRPSSSGCCNYHQVWRYRFIRKKRVWEVSRKIANELLDDKLEAPGPLRMRKTKALLEGTICFLHYF